jgi:hypothetical protein
MKTPLASVTALSLVLLPQAIGQGFGPQQEISSQASDSLCIFAADLDGDGDADAISAPTTPGQIVWHENLGNGLFGAQQVITTAVVTPRSVYAIDLDGDGDADVLSASKSDDKVAWYENLGGGSFGAQQVITTSGALAPCVYAEDLDGDGDADVLSGDEFSKIVWSENLGAGTFGSPQLISDLTITLNSLFAADLDGDGDADVISASFLDGKVAIYENLGAGTFGAQQVLSPQPSSDWPWSVYATDLDSDGDIDILSGSLYGSNNVVWYENLGGGSFGAQQAVSNMASAAFGVFATDLNGDSKADVIAALYVDFKIVWHENLMGPFDCNGNGVSDTQDIAQGSSLDCNANGVPDECDLASGSSFDIDVNGIPDECSPPPLTADMYELSVAQGGIQNFTLRGPKAFELYFLVGTTSGTSPGTQVAQFNVPINIDQYTLHTVNAPSTPPLSGSFGLLSPSGSGGMATATFTLPPAFSPSIVGLTVHHAFVTVNLQTAGYTSASNAVPLHLTM